MGKSKIKIFVFGKDNVGWAIDKLRDNSIYFLRENKFEITRNIFKADYVFCVWHSLLLLHRNLWIQLLRKIFSFKIVAIITDNIIVYSGKLNKIRKYADAFIVPSAELYSFLTKEKIQVYKIPSFVNPKVFKLLNFSKKEICEKLNIDRQILKDKIIISSFQRDSFGMDLSKPKWEKNPDLLIQILKELPREKFVFLLAGPRRHYIINQCLEKNIPYLFYGDNSCIQKKQDDILINNISLETINYLYNLTDIYVITSKSEGNPLQISESSLTRTLIFSTKVGLAPDFLDPYLIFVNRKQVCDKIKRYISDPDFFDEFIQKNYQRVKKEMNEQVVKQRYKVAILETS